MKDLDPETILSEEERETLILECETLFAYLKEHPNVPDLEYLEY